MSLVTHAVSNIINGVSQQPPSVRLDNQVEEQVNMAPDVAKGLTRRNPVILDSYKPHSEVETNTYTNIDKTFTYTVGDTKYSVGIRQDGTAYRFDKDAGTTSELALAPPVISYLAHTDVKDIKITETDSRVFITNTKQVVGTLSASDVNYYYPRLVVWMTNVIEGVTYTLTVSHPSASYSAWHTAGSTDTVEDVLNSLKTNIITAASSASVTIDGYVGKGAMLLQTDEPETRVEATDDYGVRHLKAFVEESPNFTNSFPDVSQLPSALPDWTAVGSITGGAGDNQDVYVRIDADPTTIDSSYILKWDYSNKIWTETRSYEYTKLDLSTMPHVINKQIPEVILGNAWTSPLAGDGASNPDPSFVGKTINDLVVFNSRLAIASENILVFSDLKDQNNFYRTTTSSTLTSDRVDIELDSSLLGYKEIQSIFVIGGKLFANTGETQSVLLTPSDLDITKASFANVSSYTTDIIKPLTVRNSVFLPVTSRGFGNITAFSTDNSGLNFVGTSLTKHCDRYIEGEIIDMKYTNNHAFFITKEDRNTIYVQTSYVNGEQSVQNAWHKWTFPYHIKHFYIEGNLIHLTFDDLDTGHRLFGSIDTEPVTVLPDTDTQIGYTPYLDFLTDDETTATDLGFTTIISREDATDTDFTDPNAVAGVLNESYVVLSEQVARQQNQTGVTRLGFAVLMLRRIKAVMGLTGRVTVTTEKKNRAGNTYEHVPRTDNVLVIGGEPVSDYDLRFPVNSRSDQVSIKIGTGDRFTPFNLLSFEYQANLVARGSRI